MIKIFRKLEEFKEEMKIAGIERDLYSVFNLDMPFFERQSKFILMSLPIYDEENSKIVLLISKKHVLVFSSKNLHDYEKNYRQTLKKKHGESTVFMFLALRSAMKNYSEKFQEIREGMNHLDINPAFDSIEQSGRELRRLTDRLESLVETIIVIKESEINEFNTELISFDYDVLNTEARHWLERCRSHIYRIASLRTKSEIMSNKQLNDTMGRLTVIMTFLTLVSIVVSVPGTIGAIFGIPALSDAYFKPHTNFLLIILILATLTSIILGFFYWKSLGLAYHRPKTGS